MTFEAFKKLMKSLGSQHFRFFNEAFHLKLLPSGEIQMILGYWNQAAAGPGEYITSTKITFFEYLEFFEGRLPESVIRQRFEKMTEEIIEAMLENMSKRQA